MKYILLGIISITIFISCNFSYQNRAEAAIKQLMESELGAERSYEPIEFGNMQTITYSNYLKDYIEQKQLELDSVNAKIKQYESDHNLQIDSLLLPSIPLFGGIAEGKKLLKDREMLKKQIEEKNKEIVEIKNIQKDEGLGFVSDSVYIVYHTYMLAGKTDTTKQLKRKNFVLSPRYRIVDVYNNYKIDPLLITKERKFELD